MTDGSYGRAADFVALAETILKALDASGVGMSITAEVDGKLERLYANRAGARILGYANDELEALPPVMPVAAEERARIQGLVQRWREGDAIPEMVETVLVSKSGERVPVEIGLSWADYEGAPATVAFVRDISARKRAEADRARMEEELIRKDKLATIGKLMAGVAHEVNNPLTYLLLNLERLEQELSARGLWDEPLRDMVEAARDGGDRVRHVVRDLLAFTAPARSEVSLVDPAECMRSALAMADNAFRHGVRVEAHLEEVPPVRTSTTRLGQVFLNLLVNAAQSFEDDAQRENTVRVTVRPWDEGGSRVEITDNGAGISSEELGRVFEPFYSTKPAGEGTGLGLSITRSIVASFGGRVSLESTPRRGTTAIVLLPGVAPDGASASPEVAARTTPAPSWRILLVDDEPHLSRALANALSRRHEVITHTDPREALRWLEDGGRPDIVVCDLVMPHVTGPELYRRVTQRDADLADRFLFITGGAFTKSAAAFVEQTSRPVLRKPFDLPTLERTIAACLSDG